MIIELQHGEPIRFGADLSKGVVLNEFGECEIVDAAGNEDRLLVHDEHRDDPTLAFALSRLATGPTMPTPDGRAPRRRAPVLRGGGAAAAQRGVGARRAR